MNQNNVSGLDPPSTVSLGTAMMKLPQPDEVFSGPSLSKMLCELVKVSRPSLQIGGAILIGTKLGPIRKSAQASPNH